MTSRLDTKFHDSQLAHEFPHILICMRRYVQLRSLFLSVAVHTYIRCVLHTILHWHLACSTTDFSLLRFLVIFAGADVYCLLGWVLDGWLWMVGFARHGVGSVACSLSACLMMKF